MRTFDHIGRHLAEKFEQFGKYILLEKLAAGGMAEVFLARSNAASGITKFVAIKRILPQYADSQEFIDMFKDEAKIAVNLNHSNIVSIHDFGVHNSSNQFYLVMDYVEGRNLRQILNKLKKATQRLQFDQIIYVIKEVASGLDHAHRCLDGATGKPLNITHRDMSPQNVMISFEGEVKIVDFGIAKAESQLETTRAGTLKGKFGYMSPEQAEGQPVDLRTDIFSLGIVLWELLANDRLFVASNELNTLRKIRDCQIPSLRKINPNIPVDLERITMKALARDRNLRYQTAAAMHRDLNRFLNRQFPEFSPQDFASFIKNQFAEEIFASRQRLVEYAKLPYVPMDEAPAKKRLIEQPNPKHPANSSLINVQTNSFMSGVGPEEASAPQAAEMRPEISDVRIPFDGRATKDLGEKDFGEKKSEGLAKSSASLSDSFEPNDPVVPMVPAIPASSSKLANLPRASEVPASSQPGLASGVTQDSSSEVSAPVLSQTGSRPNVFDEISQASKSVPSSSTGGVLSETAIRREINRQTMGSAYGVETENVQPSEKKSSSKGAYSRSDRSLSQDGGLGKLISYTAMLVLVVSSIYVFLAKYQPAAMHGVVTSIDPILHGFHSFMGISLEAPPFPETNRLPVVQANPIENPSGSITPNPVVPVVPPLPKGQDPDSAADLVRDSILITSSPSGAEIWLNGRPTGAITPSRVEVPAQKEFSLTLRRPGYLDYRRDSTRLTDLGSRLSATLQPALIGYLDIDAQPPQNARISINGRVLQGEHLPIVGYSVPAETPITIRAEDLVTNRVTQQVVKVPKERRVKVLLDLRRGGTKSDRQPTQSR